VALGPLLAGGPVLLRPGAPLPPDAARLWTMIGAEPNTVGGRSVPARPLVWMCDRLDLRWDRSIDARQPSHAARAARMAFAVDPLFRLEADRSALCGLLPRLLRSWPRWRQEPS
jgi:hypothetical protein